MADAAFIQALKDELINDPEALGYTVSPTPPGNEADALTDLALINAVNRTVERPTMTASEIFEAIDVSDYSALADPARLKVEIVLGLGDSIQIAPGTKARSFLLDAFPSPAADTTRNALAAAAQKTVSRAEELGFGAVKPGHIQLARKS